jgi:hypothetical protein
VQRDIDLTQLSGAQKAIVTEAGSYLWRIERRTVQRRLSVQIALTNGIRMDEITERGLRSVVLGMAGLFWAVIGTIVGVFIVIPLLLVSEPKVLVDIRIGGFVVVIGLFVVGLMRTANARRYRKRR